LWGRRPKAKVLALVNIPVLSKVNGGGRPNDRPSFNSVLVYEDVTCGEHSWNFYEKLTHRFEADFNFSHSMWSFSLLSDLQTLLLAARSAADAHLVILSFTGRALLPKEVKDWVQHWMRFATDQSSAMVTLVGQKAKSSVILETYSYLRRVLMTHKIEFFPHCTAPSAFRLRPE
jgi:hypothetical protein